MGLFIDFGRGRACASGNETTTEQELREQGRVIQRDLLCTYHLQPQPRVSFGTNDTDVWFFFQHIITAECESQAELLDLTNWLEK